MFGSYLLGNRTTEIEASNEIHEQILINDMNWIRISIIYLSMNMNIDIFILIIQIGAPYMCYRVVSAQWTNWCQLSGVLPKIEMEMIEQYAVVVGTTSIE